MTTSADILHQARALCRMGLGRPGRSAYPLALLDTLRDELAADVPGSTAAALWILVSRPRISTRDPRARTV